MTQLVPMTSMLPRPPNSPSSWKRKTDLRLPLPKIYWPAIMKVTTSCQSTLRRKLRWNRPTASRSQRNPPTQSLSKRKTHMLVQARSPRWSPTWNRRWVIRFHKRRHWRNRRKLVHVRRYHRLQSANLCPVGQRRRRQNAWLRLRQQSSTRRNLSRSRMRKPQMRRRRGPRSQHLREPRHLHSAALQRQRLP